MSGNIMRTGSSEVVEDVFDGAEAIIVNPPQQFLADLVEQRHADGGEGNVRVVAHEDVLKSVRNEFVSAATAADLVADDQLTLMTTSTPISGGMVIADGQMSGIVNIGGDVITTGAQDVEDEVQEVVESVWDDADEFQLRTPPLSSVYDSMAEELDDGVAEDFEDVVEGVGAFTDDYRFDEVAAALLVSAKHEHLLYDVSKWGEDCGMASKATFSRTKTALEDHGLLDTEKVPIDVGRPRLRLKLNEDVEGDADSIVETLKGEVAVTA